MESCVGSRGKLHFVFVMGEQRVCNASRGTDQRRRPPPPSANLGNVDFGGWGDAGTTSAGAVSVMPFSLASDTACVVFGLFHIGHAKL